MADNEDFVTQCADFGEGVSAEASQSLRETPSSATANDRDRAAATVDSDAAFAGVGLPYRVS